MKYVKNENISMQYLLKRLKLPKSTQILENSDHSKSNYIRGTNNCGKSTMLGKGILHERTQI